METANNRESSSNYEQEIRDVSDNIHSELGDLSNDIIEPKMPINDFIEEERRKGLNDLQISYKLLGEGYGKEIKDSDLSEDIKGTLNSFLNKAYSRYGYKAKDRSSFEELLFQIAQRIINKADTNLNMEEFNTKIYGELGNLEMNEPISMDFISSTLKAKNICFNIPYGEKLHGDWSNSTDVLNLMSFYNNSFGDDCKFPEGYNPHELFEKGKSIGLGIEAVHNSGYTGEGIEVAIIDNPLAQHDDITVSEHYKKPGGKPQMHGSAVASILVGKQTGIVPCANLHYVESSSELDDKDIYDDLLKLKDKNIRVISLSFNLYQEWMDKSTRDKVAGLVDEFKEDGTWVLSGDEFIKNFGILSKKNPMGNSNKFQDYQVTWPDKRTIDRRKELLNPSYEPKDEKDKQECEFTREFYDNKEIDIENLIFINSGDRTVADPHGPDSYRHDAIGGTSWTIPAVAGYYALACQADPENMNPERFMQLARDTAQLVSISDIPEDMNNMTRGRTAMQATIKVFDIKALIQKIEEERKK